MASFTNAASAERSIGGTGIRVNINLTFSINFSGGVGVSLTGNFSRSADRIGLAAGPKITNSEFQVWLNDTEYINKGDGDFTTASISQINKIRVRGYARATDFAGSYAVDTTVDTTYSMTYMNSNFCGVATNIGGTKPIVVLPDVNTQPQGTLYIVKDRTWGAGGNNISVITMYSQLIDLNNTFRRNITNNGGALSFYADSGLYRLAMRYPLNPAPGDNFPATIGANATNSPITNPNKVATAVVGRVNIFNVNLNTDRRSGDNLITLPNESGNSGQICIVVYAGNASQKSGGNALTFATASGRSIDNWSTNTNTNRAFIWTDDNQKNSGVVFICDGTNWFVVSYYLGNGWTWENNTAYSNPQANVTNSVNSVICQGAGAVRGRDYYLPPLNTSIVPNSSVSGLILIKNGEITEFTGTLYHTNPSGGGATGFFNETQIRIYNARDTPNYSCLWLVYERRSGENFLRFYPVGYTSGTS